MKNTLYFAKISVSPTQKKPVVKTDENGKDTIEVANVLPLCICFDHRALDFGEVRPFLDRISEIFENPEQILKY